MEIKYLVPEDGGSFPDDANDLPGTKWNNRPDFDEWDYELMASEAGEDYWNNHEGYENSWPLNIEIYIDGEKRGVFQVSAEETVNFIATAREG